MNDYTIDQYRQPEARMEPIFINRWSPRAMSGEPIGNEKLHSLFEAAKWAPSSYNAQPWRFLYAKRDSPHWDVFFDLLVDMNQAWAKNAAVLLVMVSKNTFEHNGKPNPVHTFDTGSAWENLALQGSAMGLVVHGMAGFDYAKAKQVLNLPDDFTVEAMAAIGKPGDAETLPQELKEREIPSGRKSIAEITHEGPWPTNA